MADGELSPLSRLVACSLAQGFANHETAECRPGLAALMKAVAASRATVLRALNDLQIRGWVERRGGNAPGKSATYAFREPGARREQVSDLRPVQVSDLRPEQVSDLSGTGLNFETPPCTPYKDKPHMNHRAHTHPRAAIRGLPMPQCLTTIIPPDSVSAGRWDEWLEGEGLQPLAKIGHRVDGGWLMPVTVAPTKGEEIPHGIALRWANWLRSKA